MKSYLTYITEIDKGPRYTQSFPDDDGPDRFKIHKFLGKHGQRINPEDALPEAGFDPYTGKEIGKDPIVRPSQHLNKEIYGGKPPKRLTDYVDDVRKKGLDKYYPETPQKVGDSPQMKAAMDQLDAQRSASPDHRPVGTPKPPKPANDADLNFFTPEEEAELKKISGDIESAKKKIAADDVETTLQKNLEKARANYDKITKPLTDTPDKGTSKLMADIEAADDYTPEQRARLDKIKGGIEKAADQFQADLSKKAAELQPAPKPPSTMSRIGAIAKTVAKNPLVRAGSKALGIVGVPLAGLGIYSDAQDIASKLTGYEKEEMERRRRDPSRSVSTSNLTSFVRSPGTKF